MKRMFAFALVLCMVLSMAACGDGSARKETTQATQPEDVPCFKAGFGMADIMPKESVPMAGYSDNRMSEGVATNLEARAVAVQDENGEVLVFVVADLTFIRESFGDLVLKKMEKKLGLTKEHVILSGTHTHASVETMKTGMPEVVRYNELCSDRMVEAARLAIEDLKPAEVYVGTAITENLNFVRRYFMDDGSFTTDNYPGTGSKVVEHETEADPELGMMKFVREGGKDILITNFQAHPHLEEKSANLSAQTVGAFRSAVERDLDVHSLHWQGAAGNLNSRSRIAGETLTEDRDEYADILCEYAVAEYDNMTKVETGPIQVVSCTYEAIIDDSREYMLEDAQKVVAYFKEGHTAGECLPLARELGFSSYYNAFRVVANYEAGYSEEAELVAWSFGDVSGVVMAYELFDTAGMQIKQDSPFEKTFVLGYSYPGTGSYIPTEEAFYNGGYERDSCRYVAGTSEEMVAVYLDLLEQMHK